MDKAIIVWIILCLIWGSTWLFIKLGLRDLPPITFAGIRFLIASAVLWAIVWWRGDPIPGKAREWLLIAWTGLIAIALNYGLVFWGEERIDSGLASVIQATIPAFGLIFAHIYLPAERFTWRKLAGVALGIAGVAVIFYDQMRFEGGPAFEGSLALVASAICVAYANVIIKAKYQNLNPATLAGGQMFFGMIPLLAFGTIREGSPLRLKWTWQAAVSLGYLALIGSALAFLLYYWLIKKIPVTRTMLISLITPVIALLLGRLALNEKVTWRIALGSAAILAGISLIVVQVQKKELQHR